MGVEITVAALPDAAELASVAAATFPLACPPTAAPDDITAFVTANLSAAHFAGYLTDPDRRVFAAREGGRIIGYAMAVRGTADIEGPKIELSKIYVLADHHGGGAASALMQAVLEWAGECGAQSVWLGVNQSNERAQSFYRRQGFAVTGTRTFQLGSSIENDFVMTRRL